MNAGFMLMDVLRPTQAETWAEQGKIHDGNICLCCGQPGHYQATIDAHVAAHGLDQGVWVVGKVVKDGHHRAVAAWRAGLEWVPVESREAHGERWLRDHGPVGWLGRRFGDISVEEMSWIVTDVLQRCWSGARPCPGGPGVQP